MTLLALTLPLLSGTGCFLVSPVPVWSVSLHRWGAVATLLTAVLHLAISPHHRVVFSRGGSGSSSPPQEPPKLSGDVAATRVELCKLVGRGLPGVQPGMSLQETLAILIDYLLDNDLVRRGGDASLRAGMG